MSNSGNAYLFFGFTLHRAESEEGDENFCDNLRVRAALEESGDLDELYVEEVAGLFHPGNGDDKFDYEDPENRKLLDKFYAKRRELMEDIGVEVHTYCNCDYPIYFLSLHMESAGDDESNQIDFAEMTSKITPKKIAKLKKFCEILEIEYQEPKWNLVSYYG